MEFGAEHPAEGCADLTVTKRNRGMRRDTEINFEKMIDIIA